LIALWAAIGLCQSMLTVPIVREQDGEARSHWRGNRRAHLPSLGRRATRSGTRRPAQVPRIATGPRG
jgi:hypothetical protein